MVHVAIAIALMFAGMEQQKNERGQRMYSAFGSPTTRAAYAINAPVFIVRYGILVLRDRLYPQHEFAGIAFDNGLFIIGVALLWLCAAAEIEARMRKQRWIAAHASLRVGAYVCLIFVGLLA